MVRKIIYLDLVLGAIFFGPWPVTLVVIMVLTFISKSIYPALISALYFDWLYGTSGHLTIGLITILIILLLTRFSRQFVRFN